MFLNVWKELTPLKQFSAWFWVMAGGLAFVIRLILSYNENWAELYYSRMFFPGIRNLFDYTTGNLPFAVIYLLLFGLLVFIFIKIRKLFGTENRLVVKLILLGHFILSVACALFFFFLVLWGYNYLRVPVAKKLGLQNHVLQTADIEQELLRVRDLAIAARSEIPSENNAIAYNETALPDNFEALTKADILRLFEALGFPTPGSVRARQIYPKGLLLRWGTAGVYIPFTGECHIDAGLHPLQKPFVLAHEYSHGLGITDEGTCNFLGFLACESSPDAFIRYSGYLAYFRTLASHFMRQKPEAYQQLRADLPSGMIADLDEINTYMLRYPDFLPGLRYWLYDNFLKIQGVKDGVASYSRIIQMVIAWERKKAKAE